MSAKRRPIHGVLLLDKPQGLSSNQALQQARNILSAEKAGHTGSLDPMATGLLPVCFGEASKFAQYGLSANKSYEAVMRLGIATTTADAMGEVVHEHPVPEISLNSLQKIQVHFKGDLKQIPPMYSALKQEGVPLYRMARQGKIVAREARSIKIHELYLEKKDEQHLHLKVHCSKGTYVRTLAEDIGKALGCAAHLVQLRRIKVGELQGPLVTLEQLMEAYRQGHTAQQLLLPIDALVQDLPKIALEKENCEALLQGKKVLYSGENPPSGFVRLYTENDTFLGVGSIDAGCYVKSERLVSRDYLNNLG